MAGDNTHWMPFSEGYLLNRAACSIYPPQPQQIRGNPEAVTCGNCRRSRSLRDALAANA